MDSIPSSTTYQAYILGTLTLSLFLHLHCETGNAMRLLRGLKDKVYIISGTLQVLSVGLSPLMSPYMPVPETFTSKLRLYNAPTNVSGCSWNQFEKL